MDSDNNMDVSVYQGDVKQKSCGTLQLTYGLEQSDQIYTLICNAKGDIVKLTKTSGVINLYEVAVTTTGIANFFPPNAFLRRRRKKALLRVNNRGGGWKMCILALCRVYVCTCVRTCARARLQLTYVAMAILRKRSQFMI